MFTQPIPPLINGVSQQANDRRLPSQLEVAENVASSPVYGLGKRPPADFVGAWDTLLSGDPFLHLIERDVDSKYLLAVVGSTIQVMDLADGSMLTVNDNTSGDAAAYLASGSASRKDLRALTIADTTWLTNRKVLPSMAVGSNSPANTPSPNTKYVWVKTSASSTLYSVRVRFGGVTYEASFSTDNSESYRLAVENPDPNVGYPTDITKIRCTGPVGAGRSEYFTDFTVVMRSGPLKGLTRKVIDDTGPTPTQRVLTLDEPLVVAAPSSASYPATEAFSIRINSEGVEVIAGILGSQLASVLPAGWQVDTDPEKALIRIYRDDDADFDLDAEDDRGSNYISVVSDAVQNFDDLPPFFTPNGYVKVRGEIGAEEDDYWVRFEADDGDTGGNFGTGTWIESSAPDIPVEFDETTVPFRLVRDASGPSVEFSLEYAGFDPRGVGDEESTPDPSFIGTGINDIFLFKNRLGFLAGDSIVMSRAGDFFNFWPSTVLNVLDDDPIDVSIGSRNVVEARHAIPFGEELIVFSDRSQAVISDNGVLTPKSISVAVATTMDADPDIRPVVADNLMFFLQERGLETLLSSAASGLKYHGVREYFADRDLGKSSRPVSDHCPKYIRGNTLSLSAGPTTSYLAVVTDEGLFTYRWYDNGNERRQSAWSRWSTSAPTDIRWAVISGPDLIYSTYDSVCRIKLPDNEPDGFDGGWVAHLDRRIRSADLTVTLDGGDTLITLPYTPSSSKVRLAYVTTDPGPPGNQLRNGDILTPTVVGNVLTVQSQDLTGVDFIVGELYDMDVELSDFQVPQGSVNGTAARTNGRVQVLSVQLNYMDSAHLTLEVVRDNRVTNTRQFTSDFTTSVLQEGRLRVLVHGRNDEVSIRLKNHTAYPCWVTGGEVELQYWNRSF